MRFRKSVYGIIGACLGVGVMLPAWADSATVDETVVVTATRKPQAAALTGSSVTVITAEEIARKGAVFVLDVLRDVPGVQVTQSGGPGGLASVRLRGEESYRTAIVLDGIKLADPASTQVSFNFGNLLAGGIERIEVLRGPQSLLYGADAIGGVIVITTKRGAPGFQTGASFEAGSYETVQGQVSLRGGSDTARFAVTLSGTDTRGITQQEAPGYVEPDPFQNLSVHLTVGIDLGPQTKLEGVLRFTDAQAQFDRFDFGLLTADTDNELATRQWSGLLGLDTRLTDAATLRLALSHMDQDRLDEANGAPFIFGAIFDSSRARGEAAWRYAISPAHDLLIGADYEEETATTDTLSASRDDLGLLLDYQALWTPETMITAGLRYDDHAQFGDHLSWRVTAAQRVDLGVGSPPARLHASAGSGFRAPSLFELLDGFSGNPNLHEETGIGFDLGLDLPLAWANAVLGVTYFDQRIEDEIRFDPIGFTYTQNPSTTQSRGLEVTLAATLLEGLTLGGAYTYTEATIASADAEDGLARLRRPRHLGSLSLNYAFLEGRGNLNANLQTAAKEQDGFFIFRSNLEGRAIVNLAASYAVSEALILTLRGQNIFDERYQEATGFSTPRSGVFLGARAVF